MVRRLKGFGAKVIYTLLAFCVILFSPSPGQTGSTPNAMTVGIEGFPTTFFPMVQTGSLSGQIAGQLFASFCRLGPTGDIEHYLAEKLEYSSNHTSLSITLRPNACFHDGTPITAEDAAFSLRVAKVLHPYSVVFETIRDITVRDTQTLSVKFAYPQPHFLQTCIPSILPIIPKHVYKTTKGITKAPLDAVVGSGPFRLDSVSTSRIVLKKFPQFFLPNRPYLDEIIFSVYNDVGDSYYRHVAKELDISAFRWDYVPERLIEQYDYLQMRTEEYRNIRPYFVLQFNLASSPFDNLLVRKAFTLAIDRIFLAQNGLGQQIRTNAAPMFGPLPQNSEYYSQPTYAHRYDIAQANALLDSAGFPRNEAGMRMKVTILIPPYMNKTFMIVQYLQYIFAQTLGVEIVINASEQISQWERRIVAGDYQVTMDELFGWHDPHVGLHRLYASSNGRPKRLYSNTIGLSDAIVDRLIQQASIEADKDKRRETYKNLQQYLGERYVSVWLATAPYTTVYNTRVRGIEKLYLGTMSPMDTVYVSDHPPASIERE